MRFNNNDLSILQDDGINSTNEFDNCIRILF